jgi:hypothetical protein
VIFANASSVVITGEIFEVKAADDMFKILGHVTFNKLNS